MTPSPPPATQLGLGAGGALPGRAVGCQSSAPLVTEAKLAEVDSHAIGLPPSSPSRTRRKQDRLQLRSPGCTGKPQGTPPGSPWHAYSSTQRRPFTGLSVRTYCVPAATQTFEGQ